MKPLPGCKGSKTRSDFFTTGYLGDVASMTILVGKNTNMFKDGVVYGQWYNCLKTIGDANGTYFFSNRKLSNLMIDPARYDDHFSRMPKSRQSLEANFMSASDRIHTLADRTQTDFADRFELRTTWLAMQRAKYYLETRAREERARTRRANSEDSLLGADGLANDGLNLQFDLPTAIWSVRTANITRFLFMNYHKFLYAFGITRRKGRQDNQSIANARVQGIMVTGLQYLSNLRDLTSGPSRALWYTENFEMVDEVKTLTNTGHTRFMRGMGMCETIFQQGYGWFRPGIDWNDMSFDMPDDIFLTSIDEKIRSFGLRSARKFTNERDALSELEDISAKLRRAAQSQPTDQKSINRQLRKMVFLCFRSYHDCIVQALTKQGDIPDDRQHQFSFSAHGVGQACTGRSPHAMSPPRNFTLYDVFGWIWTDAERPAPYRPHKRKFKKMEFRTIYSRSIRTIEENLTQNVRADWERKFEHKFFKYHWAIPYPDTSSGSLTSVNHPAAGQRCSIRGTGGMRQYLMVDYDEITGSFSVRAPGRDARPGRPSIIRGMTAEDYDHQHDEAVTRNLGEDDMIHFVQDDINRE